MAEPPVTTFSGVAEVVPITSATPTTTMGPVAETLPQSAAAPASTVSAAVECITATSAAPTPTSSSVAEIAPIPGSGRPGALRTKQLNIDTPLPLPNFTVAGLPIPAAKFYGTVAFATDAAGGPVPVFCDGVNWLRWTDRTVV